MDLEIQAKRFYKEVIKKENRKFHIYFIGSVSIENDSLYGIHDITVLNLLRRLAD